MTRDRWRFLADDEPHEPRLRQVTPPPTPRPEALPRPPPAAPPVRRADPAYALACRRAVHAAHFGDDLEGRPLTPAERLAVLDALAEAWDTPRDRTFGELRGGLALALHEAEGAARAPQMPQDARSAPQAPPLDAPASPPPARQDGPAAGEIGTLRRSAADPPDWFGVG